MKRHYLIWVAFIAASFALMTFLTRSPAPERQILCPIRAMVHADGSVQFDGVLFSDSAKLKARLMAFKKQHSDCFMSTIADSGTRQEVIEKVFGIFREAGFPSVGFLTEPRNVGHR